MGKIVGGERCAVRMCNNSKLNRMDVNFHNFPKDVNMRRLWFQALEKPDNWAPSTALKVCSLHFTPNCYGTNHASEGISHRKYLKRSAIPNILPPPIHINNEAVTLPKIPITNKMSNESTSKTFKVLLIKQPGNDEQNQSMIMVPISTAGPTSTLSGQTFSIVPAKTNRLNKEPISTISGQSFPLISSTTLNVNPQILPIQTRVTQLPIKLEAAESEASCCNESILPNYDNIMENSVISTVKPDKSVIFDHLHDNFLEYLFTNPELSDFSVKKNQDSIRIDISKESIIEINKEFQARVLIYENYLPNDHGVYEEFPGTIRDLDTLLEFLKYVKTYQLCPGTREPEYVQCLTLGLAIGYVNTFTKALHSIQCSLMTPKYQIPCNNCQCFISKLDKLVSENNIQQLSILSDSNKKILKETGSQTAQDEISNLEDEALANFQTLNDLYVHFLKLQMKGNYFLEWSIGKNLTNSSVVIQKTNSNEIGFIYLEINDKLRSTLLVFGKELEENHPLKLADRPIDESIKLRSLICLINSFKICYGFEDSTLEINTLTSNVIKNPFTKNFHSNTCQKVYVKASKICNNCTIVKQILTRKFRVKETKYERLFNLEKKRENEDPKKQRQCKLDLKNAKRKSNILRNRLCRLQAELKLAKNQREVNDEYATTNKNNIIHAIINIQMKMKKLNRTRLKKWPSKILQWCAKLYSTSAAAYDMIRNEIMLPGTRTICGYSTDFPLIGGIREETIREMRQKIDLDDVEEHQKYFSLIVQEMRDALAHNDKEDSETNEWANRVVVLMVRGITTNFKHVLAYFSLDVRSGFELETKIEESIKLLEKNGFKILLVIGDNDFKFRKVVQIQSDSTMDQVGFKRPNPFANDDDPRDTYYIRDPLTLIKTIRNAIYHSGANKYRYVLRKNGKCISWNHIREMYKKDNVSAVRMCPKLTNNHTRLGLLDTQRVNLATQVLSNTVANAVQRIMGDSASETVKFIRYFNKFFDVLNTRMMAVGKSNRNYDLEPYKSADDHRFRWLEEEFLGYLREWKDEVERIDTTPNEKRKMIVTPSIMDPLFATVHATIGIVKFLLDKGAPYVCTDRLNRDALDHRYGKFIKVDS